MLPFELEVIYARVTYWSGDHMGYLDALTALLKKCRGKARAAKGDVAIRAMWQERGARVCLIMASQLIEMKVYFLPSPPASSYHSLVFLFVGFCSSCSPPRATCQPRPQCLNRCPPIIYSANISAGWIHHQSLATFRSGRSRSECKSGS